jgi:hypothetical protein
MRLGPFVQRANLKIATNVINGRWLATLRLRVNVCQSTFSLDLDRCRRGLRA